MPLNVASTAVISDLNKVLADNFHLPKRRAKENARKRLHTITLTYALVRLQSSRLVQKICSLSFDKDVPAALDSTAVQLVCQGAEDHQRSVKAVVYLTSCTASTISTGTINSSWTVKAGTSIRASSLATSKTRFCSCHAYL